MLSKKGILWWCVSFCMLFSSSISAAEAVDIAVPAVGSKVGTDEMVGLSQRRRETISKSEYGKRFQTELLRLTNQYRVRNGRLKLSYSKKLQKAADVRAFEALKWPDLSHKRYDKRGKLRSFSSVVTDLHLQISYIGIGENLAWRAYQSSPEQAAAGMFQQWKQSRAHRRNMLDARYDTVAVAIQYDEDGTKGYEYGAAAVQLFMQTKKRRFS